MFRDVPGCSRMFQEFFSPFLVIILPKCACRVGQETSVCSGFTAAGSSHVESKKEICKLRQREEHEPSSEVFEITGVLQD